MVYLSACWEPTLHQSHRIPNRRLQKTVAHAHVHAAAPEHAPSGGCRKDLGVCEHVDGVAGPGERVNVQGRGCVVQLGGGLPDELARSDGPCGSGAVGRKQGGTVISTRL